MPKPRSCGQVIECEIVHPVSLTCPGCRRTVTIESAIELERKLALALKVVEAARKVGCDHCGPERRDLEDALREFEEGVK